MATNQEKEKTTQQSKDAQINEQRKKKDDQAKQVVINQEKEKTPQQLNDAQINELRKMLEEQAKQMTIIQEKEKITQQSKDAQINELRKELEDQAKQVAINQEKEKTAQQLNDAQINELRQEIQDKLKLMDINQKKEKASQKQKDALINKLKKELEDLTKQIAINLELEKNNQKSKDTQINELRQELQDQAKQMVTNLKDQVIQMATNQQKENNINQQNNACIQDLKEQLQTSEQVIRKLKIDNDKQLQDLQLKNLELQNFKQEQDELNAYVTQKDESQYGYDIMIKMKSIRDLENNNQQSKQKGGLQVHKFDQSFNSDLKNVKVIGMQGQRNKGKTFVLNSLINENFPSDYHLSTPGICLKHHKLDGKNILYIDSEGLSRPITFNFEENTHYNKFMDNILNNKTSENNQNEQNLEKEITEQHWDLKATEQIQQDFILQSSNILLIVVSHLTLDDQKLIITLSQRFVNDIKNPKQKQIFIVHNLKEYRRVEYLKSYFEDLKKIFPVRSQVYDNIPKLHDDENNMVLVDNVKPFINHLVMGYQNSEAGRVYNRFALEYLKSAISYNQSINNFNIQQKLYDYLNKNLRSHISLKIEQSDETKQAPIDQDILEINKKDQRIHLKDGWLIEKIKEQPVNIFGSFEKNYAYSLVNSTHTAGERVLIFELAGSVEHKSKFDKKSGKFTIIINQIKSIESEIGEIYFTTRKFEEKYNTIQICDQNEIWTHDKKRTVKENNGIIKFFFFKEIEDSFS